jgi:hypothetical protein
MFKNYIEIDEMQEKFEDTKEVIIIRKSRKNKGLLEEKNY